MLMIVWLMIVCDGGVAERLKFNFTEFFLIVALCVGALSASDPYGITRWMSWWSLYAFCFHRSMAAVQVPGPQEASSTGGAGGEMVMKSGSKQRPRPCARVAGQLCTRVAARGWHLCLCEGSGGAQVPPGKNSFLIV